MAQRTVRKAILIEALPIRPQDVRLRVPAPASRSSCPKSSCSRPTLGPSSSSSSPSFSSLRGTSASLASSDPARITSRKRQKAFTSIWPIAKGPCRPQPPWSSPKPKLVQNQQLWSGPEPEWARNVRLDMEARDQYFNRWFKRSAEPEGEPVGEPPERKGETERTGRDGGQYQV